MMHRGCITPIDVDSELIVKMYEIDLLSQEEISRKLGCSPSTVKRRLLKSGVTLRNREESDSLKQKELNLAKIVYLYKQGETPTKIASQLNVSENSIRRRLSSIGIRLRTLSQSQRNRLIKSKLGDKKWLFEQYIVQQKSPRVIERENGLPSDTVRNWLKYHGIQQRDLGEAISLLDRKGQNNHRFGKDSPHGKGKWITHNGERVYLRSSWEEIVFNYLVKEKIKFKYEEVRFLLGRTTYKPDFFIYDENDNLIAIIEIKGWLNDSNCTKMMTFQTLYPNTPFFIWDEKIINLIKKEVA